VGEFYEGRDISEIVSGGARGTDALAERYALEKKIPIKVFPSDWKKHGKSAGPLRNREIVVYSDTILAFWDGESTGTKSTIAIAKEMGVPSTIHRIDE